MGRFLSADPIEYAGGLNLYQYAGNDPVGMVDPTGEYIESIWDVGVVLLDIGILTWDWLSGAPPCVKALDATALGLDMGALAAPFIPGGAGRALAVAGRGAQATSQVRNAQAAARAAAGAARGTGRAVDVTDSGLRYAQKYHKSDLRSQNETHVYRVDSPSSLHKVGESSQGTRKGDGASIRPESQARKLRRATGQHYETRIIKTFPNKAAAKAYETRLIQRYSRRFGRPPGNPVDR